MILVNGVASEVISALDRGLAYGDGVFRTFPLIDGVARLWVRQYRKLRDDCRALAIDCPAQSDLEADIGRLATAGPDMAIKIIVTRGQGARGFKIQLGAPANRIVMSFPLPAYPPQFREVGIKAWVCRLRLAHQPKLAGIKHLNRLENVLARSEWNDPQIPEGILLDSYGNVIEGTMSNLFIARDQTLITPDLNRCGVAGVQRERVLEFAAEHDVPIRIETFPMEALLRADEGCLVNSLIGLWRIKELDRKHWENGEMAGRISCWLDETEV
jgi:4-amino-4-deoxychorismate lyase